ncbi:MAG: flavin reductase family protein [Pirellulales bacterium]
MTCTWFQNASLDPASPVVLIGLAPHHFTTELVAVSRRFAAHLLSTAQVAWAWHFASTTGRGGDKLAGYDVTTGLTGTPLLAGCLARLECQIYSEWLTGDRAYYWADVVACSTMSPTESAPRPLTDQQLFAQLSADQRAHLGVQLQADVALQRQAQAAWRSHLAASR